MPFAIIETGGKQYRVHEGDEIRIETLGESVQVGDTVTFPVLLKDDGANTIVGSPYVEGAQVAAEVVEVGRASKVSVMRFKSKSNSGGFKNKGHRQQYLKVRITAIQ